jgi:hypothetical protein
VHGEEEEGGGGGWGERGEDLRKSYEFHSSHTFNPNRITGLHTV